MPHQRLRPPILNYPSKWKIGPGQQQNSLTKCEFLIQGSCLTVTRGLASLIASLALNQFRKKSGDYMWITGPQSVKNLKDEDKPDLKQSPKQVISQNCTSQLLAIVPQLLGDTMWRSFSSYNAVLGGKRRSLGQNMMKAFHFLNWNF